MLMGKASVNVTIPGNLSGDGKKEWSDNLKNIEKNEMSYFFLGLRGVFYLILITLLFVSITFHPFHFLGEGIAEASIISIIVQVMILIIIFAVTAYDVCKTCVLDSGALICKQCIWNNRIKFYFFVILALGVSIILQNTNPLYKLFELAYIITGVHVFAMALIFGMIIKEITKAKQV